MSCMAHIGVSRIDYIGRLCIYSTAGYIQLITLSAHARSIQQLKGKSKRKLITDFYLT